MLKKHFFKLAALLFILIIYFVSNDYYYQKKAFDNGSTVSVEVYKTRCRRTGTSLIDVKNNGEVHTVKASKRNCKTLIKGQRIKVLFSPENDSYYWNKEPSKIPIYFFPFIIFLIAYLLILDRRN
ncbi:MAG: hypothetical protein WD048_09540 [Chitinophagales bacterium]